MIRRILKSIRHRFRSSVTGRFVTKLFAQQNPRETEEEASG